MRGMRNLSTAEDGGAASSRGFVSRQYADGGARFSVYGSGRDVADSGNGSGHYGPATCGNGIEALSRPSRGSDRGANPASGSGQCSAGCRGPGTGEGQAGAE